MAGRSEDEFLKALTERLPGLRRYAMVLTGNHAADDLVHDCIERALRERTRLDDLGRIGGWLRSILHNLHVDHIRRNRRRGIDVEMSEADKELVADAKVGDPVAAITFNRALGNLSFEHRQILLLVGLEGLSYREVAEELQVPMGTVMSRLARARERLRDEMDFPAIPQTKTDAKADI